MHATGAVGLFEGGQQAETHALAQGRGRTFQGRDLGKAERRPVGPGGREGGAGRAEKARGKGDGKGRCDGKGKAHVRLRYRTGPVRSHSFASVKIR
ncbi:hypothetical protein NHU_01767 [Rhodovulum sulfidophilum]|uniref:Uncharacterized protein n=1 Tax=Rhodovulum sulfidophilum TaxID=35806 RepID=A0A0D6B1D9_RHOSU|nr:hypothetical protein NHU_01767 [Rhodovulum sulfidophilum]